MMLQMLSDEKFVKAKQSQLQKMKTCEMTIDGMKP